MGLVDQPGSERVLCQARSADAHVAVCGLFHVVDRRGVEHALEPGPGSRDGVKRAGVDDLVEGTPEVGVVGLGGRHPWLVTDPLPDGHRLVHAPAVEVGADRPLEVVDEGVHLGVGHRPVEPAFPVFDVAIEGRDRRVDEFAMMPPG